MRASPRDARVAPDLGRIGDDCVPRRRRLMDRPRQLCRNDACGGSYTCPRTPASRSGPINVDSVTRHHARRSALRGQFVPSEAPDTVSRRQTLVNVTISSGIAMSMASTNADEEHAQMDPRTSESDLSREYPPSSRRPLKRNSGAGRREGSIEATHDGRIGFAPQRSRFGCRSTRW